MSETSKLDLHKYIDERLVEIEDLEERGYANTVLKEVFNEIINYSNQCYQGIESKIENYAKPQEPYFIVSGVTARKEYDSTDNLMFPMLSEDLAEPVINTDELKNDIFAQKPYFLYTLFMEADYSIVSQLLRRRKVFPCVIKTDKWEFKGTCSLRPCKKYYEKFSEIYRAFVNQGEKFCCPCIPYLNKFFEVYLETADFYDVDLITEVVIDFGEYSEYVRFNCFPIWNIQKISVIADMKPEPCKDAKHFRHIINYKRLRSDCRYMIADCDMELLEVSRNEDISVITTFPRVSRWELLCFTKGGDNHYTYPLFSNYGRSLDKLIRTEAELFRYVNNLISYGFIRLKDVRIASKDSHVPTTYNMNEHIFSEFMVNENRNFMLLTFIVREKNFYLTDILSYLVTAINEECREYECRGYIEWK